MKTFKTHLPTIFLLFFILPLSAFSQTPPFWTTTQQFSLGQDLSTEVDSCAFEDMVYVVWSDDRTGNKEIFFRSSRDAGQTWSREERLTNTASKSSQPAIACDIRNVYLVWREEDKLTSQIYLKKWDGNSWGDNILISGDQQNAKRPDIAITTIMPNSYLYIVWENTDTNGKSSAYLVRSTDSAQSFPQPQTLGDGTWETKEPTVWCGARNAYVAWSDKREASWGIFFRRWGEVQNSSEIKLSSAYNCNSPTIGGMEPNIYVSWQCLEENLVYRDVYVSHSTNYGNEWSGGVRLTHSEAESILPKVVVSRDAVGKSSPEAWLFWQDGRNGIWEIFYSTIKTDGTVSDAAPLVSSDNPLLMPDAVSTSGQIHLFWSDYASDLVSKIFYMRRDTVPPDRPGKPSHFDLTATKGYDDDKNVTFSWDSSKANDITKYNVYVSSDDDEFALAGETEINSYNLNGESEKVYRIYVEAVDEVGNISLPSEISQKIICDPDPPELMIHSPRSNSNIIGSVPIIISVNDVNLLEANVEYGISAFPSTWELLAGPFKENLDRKRIMIWDTAKLEGRYVLRITASDKAGNESKSESIVDIDPLQPVAIESGEFSQVTFPDLSWDYGTPAWSPNSNRIAFYSDEGGTEDLWLMLPDGTNRARLTRNTDIERSPSWSPSGDMMVYQSMPATPQPSKPEDWKLWVIGSDGSNPIQITFDEGSDTNPSWSPDGSAIAFDTDIDGDSEIWLITNVDKVLSGEQPQIVKLTNNRWDDRNPEWSPDGSTIVYQSNGKGSWDIYAMEADGDNPQPLIATAYDEIEPDWSPDRKWIIFSSNESDDHYEIKAINWPQQSEQVILSSPNNDAHNASWSPQMDMIAYESRGLLYTTTLAHPVRDIEAIISYPRGGDMLTGKVDIKGMASGNNFAKYTLQYFDPKSSKYISIGGESTAQVRDNKFLGQWNTEKLEGQYMLRLIVRGVNGEYMEDTVWVTISNRLPFIVIDEPEDGFVAKNSIIDVKGRAEAYSMVTLNDSLIKLNTDGSFSRQIQLIEGENIITIKVRNGLDQNSEFTVQRKVILDTTPPKLTIESPTDFQVVHVPYITVRGNVNEKAEVSILSSRAWTDDNGNFERKVSLNEGDNIITVSASDMLGQYSSVQLRVIFERDAEIMSDPNPPAIVDAFPDNRAVYTGKSLKISAKLIDDFGLDPFNINFWFDEEEIENTDYKLDISLLEEDKIISIDEYPTINITYEPTYPIEEGQHSFKIHIEDTSGNIAESSFSFSIDTIPAEALVSAFLSDTYDSINIVVSTNKPLIGINSISVIPQTDTGYSISTLTENDGHYEASLNISPSQKSLVIKLSAQTYLGNKLNSEGYLAWDTIRSGEQIMLGSGDSASFLSDPVIVRSGNITATLRSQDGLDESILSIYRNDIEYKGLKYAGLIYILSTSPEPGEGMITGVLSLPTSVQSDIDPLKLVMFRWDDKQMQWQALDRLSIVGGLLSSKIKDIGTYALFADTESPSITNVSPMDTEEVPLDRFFVDATITDTGSGIAQINVIVDDKKVSYEYGPLNGRLTYYPSELEWGFHKMQIIATDRAGNVSEFITSFQTREVFQFIKIKAYPNPARDNIKIEFKLTRSAEVTLKIFTINGQLVYETTKNDIAQSDFLWKCKNNSGNKVASGVYIYLLEAQIYETKIHQHGKIAIIR